MICPNYCYEITTIPSPKATVKNKVLPTMAPTITTTTVAAIATAPRPTTTTTIITTTTTLITTTTMTTTTTVTTTLTTKAITTTTTTTTTTTGTTTTTTVNPWERYHQYRRANPYEHNPLSYKAWKLKNGLVNRIKRTSLRSNTIPHSPEHPALKLGPSIDHPTTPKYKAATTPDLPELPHWHAQVTETRVHFQSRGKMIGSLNFGHLVIDLDLKRFVDKARKLCGKESKWIQNIEKVRKSARALFQDVLLQYELQCKQLIFDLEETESIWLDGKISVRHRKKRQFFMAGMLAGAAIVAISSYFFSNSALIDISTGSSQNPLTIRHLQDHEKRITVNERSIDILKEHIENLNNQIKVDHENIQIINLLVRTQPMMADLVRDLDELRSGLQQLFSNRLSQNLVQGSQLKHILKEVTQKLNQLNLVPAISHTSDLFKLESSHMIFENGTIRVFVHIPAYRKGSLMDLHLYLGSPVHIGGGHFIHPQPFGTFLSSNSANTLFRTFTPQEFSFCHQVSGTFYCKNTNWYRKRYQDNCLINLFLGDTERIKEHCQFVISKETETLTQINHKTFHLFSLQPSLIELQCPGYKTTSDKLTFSGAMEIYLQPECSASTGSYEMEGSADVFGKPSLIKFHNLDIFSSTDYESLTNNFKSLPHRSLDLIGSSKGMKIVDIQAEFAAQKLRNHIRIGFMAGIALIFVTIIIVLVCMKCMPCITCCKWLCRRKRVHEKDNDDHEVPYRPARTRRQRQQDPEREEDVEMRPLQHHPSTPDVEPATAPPTYQRQLQDTASKMRKVFE